MSKELEALANLMARVSCGEDNINKAKYDYEIIETALKRLANYEQNEDFNKDVLNYAFLNEQDKIKKLKALELVKEKVMPLVSVEHETTRNGVKKYRVYDNEGYDYIELTKDEYDLLKEVLL